MELLNHSAISLHSTLSSAWGTLYVQNAQVFSDLYADLRRYYRGSNVNLEEVLNEFWVRLLEKLLHHTNKQSLAGTTHILPSTWLKTANFCAHDIMQSECPFSEQIMWLQVRTIWSVCPSRWRHYDPLATSLV